MQNQAIAVDAYAGGYIAEIENEVVVGANLEELEARLQEKGYSEGGMPVLESIPPSGLNLF